MHSMVVLSCLAGIAAAQSNPNCDTPCNTYLVGLKNVETLYSQNVYLPGGEFARPAVTIQNVCQINGNQIQTCFECSTDNQGLSYSAQDLAILHAWWETCATYQAQGVDRAYACWQSIPNESDQCAYLASDPQNDPTTTTPSNQPTPSSSISPTDNSAHTELSLWYHGFIGLMCNIVVDALLW